MENHEQKPASDSKKSGSMDHVLNELRSVLSGLGSPAPAQPPSPPPPPPPVEEVSYTPPPAMVEPPIFNPEPKPFPSSPVASDQDFWSGNVLGWPSKQEPSSSGSVPVSNPFISEEPMPEPIVPPLPLKAPLSYEKPALEGEPFSLDTPFLNKVPKLDDQVKFGQSEMPVEDEEPLGDPWGIEQSIPEMPKAPLAQPKLDVFESPKIDLPPTPPSPPPAFMPSPQPIDAGIPIPGDLKEPEVQPKKVDLKKDDPLNLEGDQLKPEGVVQIACVFPEGQERVGQQFVNKLKELSDKSKNQLKIEPVFVSGWSDGQVDITAWKKSSKLSGSDILFVLVFKKDLNEFRKLLQSPIPEDIRVRPIALEQVPLRTLYADILIDLENSH